MQRLFQRIWRYAAAPIAAGITVLAVGWGQVGAVPPPLGLLSLDAIFAEPRRTYPDLDESRLRTLLVTGDVGLVRMINVTMVETGDFTWPFHEMAEPMRVADITFINLEGPLVPGCPLRTSGLVFCGDPRNVEGLTFAGVDVAALANNHMFNHGQAGLDATREILEAEGIAHAGYGLGATIEHEGVTFGFLSYNAAGQAVDLDAMQREIDVMSRETNVVVVMFHWGAEYVRIPVPVPGWAGAPRDLARAAIDAGATLVVGNHPHWFQGVELYRGRMIAYAFGNFAFDQPWSVETQQGMVGLFTFLDDRLIDAEFTPVRLHDWGQPRPADEPERSDLLRIMHGASQALEPY